MDNTFDKMFYPEGELLAGIDESGVSDIAGPLVAACVILPRIDRRRDDLRIFEVDDSKKIPEKWRKHHAEVIWQTAIAIGIGEVSAHEVDFLNKQKATSLAMFRAVAACKSTVKGKLVKPDFLIVDGDFPVQVTIPQAVIRSADEKSLCVAAASIVAKVYRDDIMVKLHSRYPYYDWHSNKGFPCEAHFKGIDKYGIQPGVHRTRFWPFVMNPSYAEEHERWNRRRRLWRKVTLENQSKEMGDGLWTSRPPLWKRSRDFSRPPRAEERSGSDTKT